MTNRTIAALQELAQSITDCPADARELKVYGHLPEHLVDVLQDIEADQILVEILN